MSITGSLIVYRNDLEKTPSLVSSRRVDSGSSRESLLFGTNGRFVNGIGHWFDLVVFEREPLYGGPESALASCLNCELENSFCAAQLGPP